MRSTTDFRTTVCPDTGAVVTYTVSDEPGIPAVGIVSVRETRPYAAPSARLTRAGNDDVPADDVFLRAFAPGWARVHLGEDDEPYPARGLLVVGTHKGDRMTLDEADVAFPSVAAAIRAALA